MACRERGEVLKALTYEQLLLLDPDAIRELYPFGAKEWKKRWIPVLEGDEADRPLKRLLKDKKDTIEKPRYLRAGYSVPGQYVRNPTAGPDNRNDNYTESRHRALGGNTEPEEAVPKEDQKRFSAEAKERDEARADGTPLWETLRALEDGMSERQKESIRRRVEAARRASNKKAA